MKFEKQVSLKWAIALVLIACLVSSSIVYYAIAVSPSSAFTISSGVYPGAPSYTVWAEGATYYAKDSYGNISYSGTDAGTVIQSAINALTFGKILIKSGEYYVKTLNLTGKKGITIEGELLPDKSMAGNNIGTALVLANNTNDDMFKKIESTEDRYAISLRNLVLRGNKAYQTAGCGINFGGSGGGGTLAVLENVKVYDFKGNNVQLLNGAEALLVNVLSRDSGDSGFNLAIEATTLINCIASHNSVHGFALGFRHLSLVGCQSYCNTQIGFSLYQLKKSTFVGCRSWANYYHGFMLNGGEELDFDGCGAYSNSVSGNNVYSGFYIYNSSRINVLGGGSWNDPSAGSGVQKYGIIEDTSDYDVFEGVKVDSNGISNIVIVGAHSVASHCKGYVTENSGTATISASTSITFDHGLAGTPTHVECGFKTAGYGSWIWSATTTNITITVATSGTYTFSWYAEYKP
jgi:hypothetical protein